MTHPVIGGMDERLVARLESLGIVGAYDLVRRHRDEASEALEVPDDGVTQALIETLLDMATLWQREHPIKEALEHLVINALCLGYRIGTEQAQEGR